MVADPPSRSERHRHPLGLRAAQSPGARCIAAVPTCRRHRWSPASRGSRSRHVECAASRRSRRGPRPSRILDAGDGRSWSSGSAAVLALVVGRHGRRLRRLQSRWRPGATRRRVCTRTRPVTPVLVVKGFNSRWDGVTYRWVRGDHRIRRFSYRGLDARRPSAAPTSVTTRTGASPTLAREMRRQVDGVATTRPASPSASSPRARARSWRRCTSRPRRARRSTPWCS